MASLVTESICAKTILHIFIKLNLEPRSVLSKSEIFMVRPQTGLNINQFEQGVEFAISNGWLRLFDNGKGFEITELGYSVAPEYEVELGEVVSHLKNLEKENQMSLLPRVLVLTAIPVEAKPFIDNFKDPVLVIKPSYSATKSVFVSQKGNHCEIFVQPIETGNVDAALNSKTLASELDPDLVIFSGIAGGRKETKIGDVVVSNFVYFYESGKIIHEGIWGGTKFINRPRNRESNRYAKNVLSAIAPHLTQPANSSIFFKPILSGEKVVATNRGWFSELLKDKFSDAYAVEMEGYGFLSAMQDINCPGILVRGISDVLSNKSEQENHQLASENAMEVTLQIISKYVDAEK